jgi:hypothetical protein
MACAATATIKGSTLVVATKTSPMVKTDPR